MIRYDVYLAGAMHNRIGREVLAERASAKAWCKKLGLSYYDPAEDETIPLDSPIDVKPNRRRMAWYVRKDDKHIDQCRTLLILTGDTSSAGTLWEAGRMYYKNERPIIAVAPRMCDGLIANFTTIKAHKLFKTQVQALRYIKRFVICRS